MKKLFFILVLLAFSSTAQSGFVSGNELIKYSDGYVTNKGDTFTSGYYLGYVVSVADITAGDTWCPNQEVEARQLARIVNSYLKKHPEQLHKSGYMLVRYALMNVFPCKQ